MTRLVSPAILREKLPAPFFPQKARSIAAKILSRKQKRLAIIVGPCSIHDPIAAIEYAKKLSKLAIDVEKTLFLVMRVFIEKARSKTGWKGILYDPHLDSSNDVAGGLKIARQLLVDLAHLGVPTATELLDPLASFYFDDLITWGIVGARTSSSQPHRQMASRFAFPVGFKNDCSGLIEPAVFGIETARQAHSQIGLDPDGFASEIRSGGNPWTHLILRRSDQGPNYDKLSLENALKILAKNKLEPRLMIDCSHGNSSKDLGKQKEAFFCVIEQAASNPNSGIFGAMLESHILSGAQVLKPNPSSLAYGVSVTDPCLSWEETEELIRWADSRLAPTSMSFVQN